MSNRNTTADDEIVDTQNLLRLILFALETEKFGNTMPFYQGVATAIDKLDFALGLLGESHLAIYPPYHPEVLAGMASRLETDDPCGPSEEMLAAALEFALSCLAMIGEDAA